MFSLDRWHEILDTLWRNKLRTTLTALSMAWGIFMLVILLGLGNGLQGGVEQGFAADATNSIWIFNGNTSVPYDGLPVGRRIQFNNRDVEKVAQIQGAENVGGRYFIKGNNFGGGDLTIKAGDKVSPFEVRSVSPGYAALEASTMATGRYINELDIRQRRKVAVIGTPVADFLFQSNDCVGKWIDISGVPFQVVGVFDDAPDDNNTKTVHIPLSTAQAAFNGADRVNIVMMTTGNMTVEQSQALADQTKAVLAESHDFDPDDPQAVRVQNSLEQFERFQKIFTMIDVFIWFMAGCAIIAGIVGVSNIMMIVVRERTKEIGVRKALGATPYNIVSSIVQEAVFLTASAGYLGMVAGVGLLTLISSVVPKSEMFAEPHVNLGVAVAATVVLVLAGALAGFFPALQAAKVNPIVALRDE